MIPPHQICRLLGHKREGFRAGYYHDRRGRQRERWHQRCKRCGTSDGGTLYERGLLEFLTLWELKRAWWRAKDRFRSWRREDCIDCGKRKTRFGRAVGDHRGCEEIPF